MNLKNILKEIYTKIPTKILYCKQIEKCNLQYSSFFRKFKCNI
jgi:hypothetical protein